MTLLPPIRYFCDLTSGNGYNNAARGYLQALKHCGYGSDNVRVLGISGGFAGLDLEGDWLKPYVFNNWGPEREGTDKINVVHAHLTRMGEFWTAVGERYNIGICTWETDRLPQEVHGIGGRVVKVVEDLNKFDELWVPSAWLVEVFKRSGITAPIYVVPHALLDETVADAETNIPTLHSKTMFYSIGSWNERKNAEGLLRAYLSSGLGAQDPVQLRLHVVPAARDRQTVLMHSEMACAVAKSLHEAAQSLPKGPPAFGLLTSPRPLEFIHELHRTSDVYLTLSHGEAFGLGAIEALAYGNHVIGGGPWLIDQLNYIDETTEVDISELLHTSPYSEIGVTPMPEAPGYLLDQNWYHVDVKAMSLAIQGMVPPPPVKDRKHLAKAVRDTYSSRGIAKIVQKRLDHALQVVANSGW